VEQAASHDIVEQLRGRLVVESDEVDPPNLQVGQVAPCTVDPVRWLTDGICTHWRRYGKALRQMSAGARVYCACTHVGSALGALLQERDVRKSPSTYPVAGLYAGKRRDLCA
jgi:hypothetical protein